MQANSVNIGEVARGRDNNFNLLRMTAASAVLVSHAYPIAYGDAVVQPLQRSGFALGTLAVILFFGLSGFFIASSFDRGRNVYDFGVARALRLMPAFVVSVVLSAYLLGPWATNLPITEYFSSRTTHSFITTNLTFRTPQWGLPGVFAANPFSDVVNGSIWTLRYEVMCYLAALAVGCIGLKANSSARSCVLIGLLVWYVLARVQQGAALPPSNSRLILMPAFYVGFVLYTFRSALPFSAWLAVSSWVVVAVLSTTAIYFEALTVAITYSALYVGYRGPSWLLSYNKAGDYSYGIYVYAFPIQQAIVHSYPGITAPSLIVVSFLATICAAVASWHLVEKPALALKRKLRWEAFRFAVFGPRDPRSLSPFH